MIKRYTEAEKTEILEKYAASGKSLAAATNEPEHHAYCLPLTP